MFLGMVSSPEKSIASRGKRRTGKMVKSRSILSRTSTKPVISTQEGSSANMVEMIDEAIQTEIIIPDKPLEESETENILRRMSILPLSQNLVKELSDMDENTNWVSFCKLNLLINFSTILNSCPSTRFTASLSTCLSLFASRCCLSLSVRLFLSVLYVYPSLSAPASLSVCPCFSVLVFLSLSVCPSLSNYLYA